MKKFLFLGALAAMLLGTASCSNEMEPQLADDGMVQFTIELPGTVDSRAIADGLTANKLTVAVYDENGVELTQLQVNKDIPHQTTVNFKLVKGQKYSFAFWAQAEGAPYTFDTENKSVSVDYTNAKCNDETRDAFYAYKTLTVEGPINQTVYLTRPFAQLNYGADDLAAAKAAGIVPLQTKLVVSKVANIFNLATGEATGEVENVEFALADLPDATTDDDENVTPATLTVENKPYAWMEMSYFLVPNNEANVDVEMTATTTQQNVYVPVANVPVKKNHRTNIVGSLFTEDAIFNVIIDENFDVADYNIDYNAPVVTDGKAMVNGTEYDTLADALAAATDGETVYLGAGTYNEAVTVPANGNVSIHAGNGLSADDVIINKQITAAAGSTLDLKNVSVATTATADAVTSAAIQIAGATATLDGVHSSGQRGVNIDANSNVVIKNSLLEGNKGTYQRGVNIMGDGSEVEIQGSEIRAGWYAINLVGTAVNNNIKVENTTIHGWAAVNIWKTGNTVELNNCEIYTPGNYSGESNAFAAFVYNTGAQDNTIKLTNSSVLVESLSDQPMALVILKDINNSLIGRNVDITGRNTKTGWPVPTFWIYGEDYWNTFTLDIDNTVKGTWDDQTFNADDIFTFINGE